MNPSGLPGRAEIESAQTAALRAMIRVLRDNPFYAARLRDAGIGESTSLTQFRSKMPFTTKQELVDDQLANPPFGTNLAFPIDSYTRFSQTSGTFGTPLRWLDTNESWSWMVGNWARVLEASGVRAGDRIFFAFSFGPFLGFWTAFEAGSRIGCLCIPGGGMSSEARLRAILDNSATVLCCTPTYALRLGETAHEAGIDPSGSRIRAIIVAGEPGAGIPAVRSRIEALWPGARVYDHHGMTETGPVTYECPATPGTLHVMESGFIPEVIAVHPSDTSPVTSTGELILTSLGRIGSPLLRYRTGDIVKLGAESSCACGSFEMALEGGILGRSDDMVVIRGVNLYPSAVDDVIRRFADVLEYRIEITEENAMLEASAIIEPAANCPDSRRLAQTVESDLRTAFALRIPVSIAASGVLPRFEHKAKRWTRS